MLTMFDYSLSREKTTIKNIWVVQKYRNKTSWHSPFEIKKNINRSLPETGKTYSLVNIFRVIMIVNQLFLQCKLSKVIFRSY